MVAIMKIVLLAATAAAASILRRDATPLVNSINNQIVPQLNTISADVDAFPGSGVDGSIKLDADVDSLNTILDTATTLARQEGTLSLLDTLDVVTAIGPVVTAATGILAALDLKVTDFNIIGRLPFVLASLQILNIRLLAFSNQLIALAPLGQAQALQTAQTTVLSALNTTITAFVGVNV